MKTIPYISTTGSTQTSASGETFINLGGVPAHEVVVINRSGTELEVRTANSADAVPLANGASLGIGLAASLAEVGVRRADLSNTPATVHFISSRYYHD